MTHEVLLLHGQGGDTPPPTTPPSSLSKSPPAPACGTREFVHANLTVFAKSVPEVHSIATFARHFSRLAHGVGRAVRSTHNISSCLPVRLIHSDRLSCRRALVIFDPDSLTVESNLVFFPLLFLFVDKFSSFISPVATPVCKCGCANLQACAASAACN